MGGVQKSSACVDGREIQGVAPRRVGGRSVMIGGCFEGMIYRCRCGRCEVPAEFEPWRMEAAPPLQRRRLPAISRCGVPRNCNRGARRTAVLRHGAFRRWPRPCTPRGGSRRSCGQPVAPPPLDSSPSTAACWPWTAVRPRSGEEPATSAAHCCCATRDGNTQFTEIRSAAFARTGSRWSCATGGRHPRSADRLPTGGVPHPRRRRGAGGARRPVAGGPSSRRSADLCSRTRTSAP